MSSRVLATILLVSFLLRIAAVVMIGGREANPDADDDYLPMAANLIAGNGFVNAAGEADSVRGPTYAIFIAAAQLMLPGDGVKPILWAQAILDTLTAAVVATVAWQTMNSMAGLIAALLYGINPLAIYACTIVGPEIVFAFLLTTALALYMRGVGASFEAGNRYGLWLGIAGCLIGFAVLSRATPVMLVPIWGLWLLIRQYWHSGDTTAIRNRRLTDSSLINENVAKFRRGVVGAVILAVFSASVVLPWTYRNWVVFQEFIPVVANGGVNFYAGSSQRFWVPPPEHHRQRELCREELMSSGEIAAGEIPKKPGAGDKYQYTLGMANYRLAWNNDPVKMVVYLFRKSMRLWYATQSGRKELFVGGVNAIWGGLAAAGLLTVIRKRCFVPLVPCALTVAYFPLVLTAMFPLARYAVGFTPCLCILAAAIALQFTPRTNSELVDETAILHQPPSDKARLPAKNCPNLNAG